MAKFFPSGDARVAGSNESEARTSVKSAIDNHNIGVYSAGKGSLFNETNIYAYQRGNAFYGNADGTWRSYSKTTGSATPALSVIEVEPTEHVTGRKL